MISINEAKRLVKRIILSNIATNKKDLFLTPLISGKHGIGKSQMIKSIANEINGTCITIEGGTLKEGEITGLPYQYVDNDGKTKFKFLPYYAVERIQEEEKRLFHLLKPKQEKLILQNDEAKYAMNNLTVEEKIKYLLDGTVHPVLIFIDEINRTESTVYKELMNILLTKSVNGYEFPWWVFFVGAMNPSTQNSIYATNEMDPAQLDRFVKIKVYDNTNEWLHYAMDTQMNKDIIQFIKDNPKCLSENTKELLDEEKPTPSPRGWDMVNTIISSVEILKPFFKEEENKEEIVKKDLKTIFNSKLGVVTGEMFTRYLNNKVNPIDAEDILDLKIPFSQIAKEYQGLNEGKRVQTIDNFIDYLKHNIEILVIKNNYDDIKKRISDFMNQLDSSLKLNFVQQILSGKTEMGNDLISYLYTIITQDMLDLINSTADTKKALQ